MRRNLGHKITQGLISMGILTHTHGTSSLAPVFGVQPDILRESRAAKHGQVEVADSMRNVRKHRSRVMIVAFYGISVIKQAALPNCRRTS